MGAEGFRNSLGPRTAGFFAWRKDTQPRGGLSAPLRYPVGACKWFNRVSGSQADQGGQLQKLEEHSGVMSTEDLARRLTVQGLADIGRRNPYMQGHSD